MPAGAGGGGQRRWGVRMLSEAPISALPLSSSEVELVFPEAFRAWDDSAPLFEVLDLSEGLPDGE